jgi:sigma-B regulation protein RsbU (phosphoserine phosphatase)
MALPDPEQLSLTDFLDLPTLQEIQDSFAAVAQVKAVITDAAGNVLTQAKPTKEFLRRQRALAEATIPGADGTDNSDQPQRDGAEFIAPIIVNEQRLGTIRMSANSPPAASGFDEAKVISLSEKFGLDARQIKSLMAQLNRARNTRPASIQLLFLMANAIARLCFQEFQLRQRINELTAVYEVAMMLADSRDLQKVLTRTVKVVCEVMETKAASIRLLDEEHDELVIKAVYNLSPQYLAKGPVRMSTAGIDQVALSRQRFEYVQNMALDPRVRYPQESVREGIVSMLSVGLRYKGKPIGVLRVYTSHEQRFSPLKIDLLKAVAAQAAAAIENARLFTEIVVAEALEKQVQLAADVQQRMIPQKPPQVPGIDVASVYVPCYALGGDFFDFITLPGDNLGLAIADVSGKGVPASLIMASVRAFLRAQVDNVYYLYEAVRRINLMLCRDTKSGEFVTLFYGVLDAHSLRFTYCNAGHPPGLVLRNGQVIELQSDNMVLGLVPEEPYVQTVFDFQKGDLLLLYTDGLTDGMNFDQECFGRPRLIEAMKRAGEMAGGNDPVALAAEGARPYGGQSAGGDAPGIVGPVGPSPAEREPVAAETIAQHILWELRKFVGMAKPTDDITMIVARVGQ